MEWLTVDSAAASIGKGWGPFDVVQVESRELADEATGCSRGSRSSRARGAVIRITRTEPDAVEIAGSFAVVASSKGKGESEPNLDFWKLQRFRSNLITATAATRDS